MATENQQDVPESASGRTFGGSEVPSEHELFAGKIQEELSEQQAFVGDEDFYKFLAESAQPTEASASGRTFGGLPLCKKILVAGVVLIVAILLYMLLKSPSIRHTSGELEPRYAILDTSIEEPASRIQHRESSIENPASRIQHRESSIEEPASRIQHRESSIELEQPLSLKVAQEFYLQGDYNKAYAVYNQLRSASGKMRDSSPTLGTVPIFPAGTEEELLKDFLQLKMALCMKKTADYEQAGRLLKMASKSRSPAVKAIANYHRCLLEMQKKQYLNARTRAYQAISLIDAVDRPSADWVFSLKRDCHFLVAEALTRNVLSLCGVDKDLPTDLWSNPDTQKDPFINLNETQLRTLLNSGSAFGGLSKGLLEPQVQELERQSGLPRYSVVCCGAPIEELLARLVANTVLDINWAFNPDSVGIRKRPVNVYLQGATTHQLVTTAAGCVGLLARQSAEGRIDIFNPENYCSLSEHKQLLSDEAILLWQKFLLAFHNDERIGNAHFALGLLQSQKGLDVESIAEYKLVANRFSKTSLAPSALFHSSKLKAALRDYSGARQDLKQLVEQYPHTEIADQAYLYLAETTAKMGLKTEAARLYRKVYNLGLSSELQSVAAVRAGRCFYEIKDYESAEKWLSRYISLVKNNKSKDWCSAYLLLGKTNIALGKHQQGCDAFRHALKGHISREEYVETVSALVGGYMEQGHFVQALDVLEDIRLTAFSEKESVEISLLKSKILRAMGLIDKAIAILGDKAEYTSDPQLKAKISLELTDCHIAKGNLEPARRKLTKILAIIKPGPLAQETALKLADVCLKLGQNSQSISICSQLLDSAPSERIRQKTLKILAIAYNQQKNYDKAALALLGQWK